MNDNENYNGNNNYYDTNDDDNNKYCDTHDDDDNIDDHEISIMIMIVTY